MRLPAPVDLTVSAPPSRSAAATYASSAEEILRRIRGEYLEMPGLRLTVTQARRLWAVDAAMCDTLLATLVDAGFLRRTADGRYARVEPAA